MMIPRTDQNIAVIPPPSLLQLELVPTLPDLLVITTVYRTLSSAECYVYIPFRILSQGPFFFKKKQPLLVADRSHIAEHRQGGLELLKYWREVTVKASKTKGSQDSRDSRGVWNSRYKYWGKLKEEQGQRGVVHVQCYNRLFCHFLFSSRISVSNVRRRVAVLDYSYLYA